MIKSLILLLTLLCNPVAAQVNFLPEVNRVAVFKNGYAFTYREAETEANNGWVYTGTVPAGALGTIWGYSLDPKVRITQLLASNSDRKESKRIENLAEYLLTNEGSRARFTLNNEKNVEGTYEVVMQGGDFLTSQKISLDAEAYKRIDPSRMSLIVRAQAGALFLPLANILSVEIIGQPKIDRPVLIKENRLAMKVAGATGNVRLGIAALERGIQWIPSYRVEVKGSPVNEAKLELEAILVNDMTDLKDADVYFVVGVPHFLFQNEISPLAINQTFAGVSGNLQQYGRILSNAAMTTLDAGVGLSREISDPSPTIDDDEQAQTLSAEQLFLYKADALTLKKGERAAMRFFSLTVPCSEVFEWTIDDAAQPINYASHDGLAIRVPAFTNRFWYGLRLKNETEMPWTTAPAISFREWRPMGQDLLTFTPVGGENVLRVSPATEVIGTHRIVEKSRAAEQKRINGAIVSFDLVTLEGIIEVKNVKKQPVDAVVTRNLTGKITGIADGGIVTREGSNIQSDNPHSVVKWNLAIPPGTKEIRYSYKVYVRK